LASYALAAGRLPEPDAQTLVDAFRDQPAERRLASLPVAKGTGRISVTLRCFWVP